MLASIDDSAVTRRRILHYVNQRKNNLYFFNALQCGIDFAPAKSSEAVEASVKFVLRQKSVAPLASIVGAMVLFFAPTVAGATTLDFDEYPGLTIITTQYAAQGVTFENTVEDSPPFPNPGYPTESGTGEITDGNFVDNITAIFSTPTTTVSGYYTDPYGIQANAYNSIGTLISTETLPDVYSAIVPFSISNAAGISSVVFLDLAPNGLTAYEGIDNLTFGAASAVPEPASWLMMFVGLSGVGLMRRGIKRRLGCC